MQKTLELLCSAINEPDTDGASSIAVLQEVFNDSNKLKALYLIWPIFMQNLSFLSQSTTKLEKTTNLSQIITLINGSQYKLNKSNCSKADAVKQKFSHGSVTIICDISCVLKGEDMLDSEDLRDSSVSNIVLQIHSGSTI
jgi:hypothetical protein